MVQEKFVKIQGASIHYLEGAGHPAYLDAPEEFHYQLVAFVRSLVLQDVAKVQNVEA
ncbi:MAG: hypothetical protein H7Y37_06655 [Anaerolineae bacterium]|nr:hypothetical protein [Gloeobacterales cyanobacterium ES-bin-313]